MTGDTRYAKSGDVHIAYRIDGEGPIDLVFVMGWVSHLDYLWDGPASQFLTRLASFSRLITFDKRGTGLSDRTTDLPTIEQRMDDVRAVMDAAGSRKAALLGISEGGAMCAVFAATYPERTSALALYGGYAKREWHPDYPWAPTEKERRAFYLAILQRWGGVVDLDALAPSTVNDPQFREWWAQYLRHSASPGAALALARMNTRIDIRHVLPAIQAPTLIVHRTGDRDIDIGGARYMAQHIPGATFVELPGDDHLVFAGDQEAVLGEVELFLTGVRPAPEPDRVLATILVAEIVGAMGQSLRAGEQAWQRTLAALNQVIASSLGRYRGQLARTTPAGFAATFDGPARAIHAAQAIVAQAGEIGVELRTGLHVGECELGDRELRGIAGQIASRAMSRAAAGDVLVTSTVTDLVAGSGIAFKPIEGRLALESGRHVDLYRVAAGPEETAPDEIVPETISQPLSPRELEVAVHIGQGHTNRQVADELSISIATVERHVANIFTKLGVHSRTQVATWVAAQGLLRVRND